MDTTTLTTSQTLVEELSNTHAFSRRYRLAEGVGATLVFIANSSVQADIAVALTGPQASANIIALVLGRNSTKIGFTTTQHHTAAHTTSDLLVKSVLYDAAQFSYKGTIRVEKSAQNTNAYQQDNNLLMSKKAQVDTKPALEILANDVRCTHGATTGSIDEEQLFYLKSRGINRSAGEQLIVEGFLHSILSRIDEKAAHVLVQDKIQKMLNTK